MKLKYNIFGIALGLSGIGLAEIFKLKIVPYNILTVASELLICWNIYRAADKSFFH